VTAARLGSPYFRQEEHMSFVITPPGTLASWPFMADAWLPPAGSQDCPRDGADMGANRRSNTVSKWTLDGFAGTTPPSNCQVREEATIVPPRSYPRLQP
jgi:hypothetical protein